MLFSDLSQDMVTKILVSAADETTIGRLARINRYTYTTLFNAPLNAYSTPDQANLYLMRARHWFAQYGTTFAKSDLFKALESIICAYTLNEKLDHLWLDNITALIYENVTGDYCFRLELIRWLESLHQDKQHTLHHKPKWLLYFMGLADYFPIMQLHFDMNKWTINGPVKDAFAPIIDCFAQAAQLGCVDALGKLCCLSIRLGRHAHLKEHCDKGDFYLQELKTLANNGQMAALSFIAEAYELLATYETEPALKNQYQQTALDYYTQQTNYDTEAHTKAISLCLILSQSNPSHAARLQTQAKLLYQKLEANKLKNPKASYLLATLWLNHPKLAEIIGANRTSLTSYQYSLLRSYHYDTYGSVVGQTVLPIGKLAREILRLLLLSAKQSYFKAQHLLHSLSNPNSEYDKYIFNSTLYEHWTLNIAKHGYIQAQKEMGFLLQEDSYMALDTLPHEQKMADFWLTTIQNQWRINSQAETEIDSESILLEVD